MKISIIALCVDAYDAAGTAGFAHESGELQSGEFHFTNNAIQPAVHGCTSLARFSQDIG
jgi:hypothetical protein